MKISKISLPHPVLGLRDDIEGVFSIESHIVVGPENVEISIEYTLKNDTLSGLVDENKAILVMDTNCANTFYRNAFKFKDKKKTFVIPVEYLRDKVEVSFFIIVETTIENYRPLGINLDYGEKSFFVSSGDVLAYGGSGSFIVEKNWKRLKKLSSFMVIEKGDWKHGLAKYDLSGDRIIIRLSDEDYERTKDYQNIPNIPNLFHSGIIYPALLYAISTMFSEKTFQGVNKWADYLEETIDNDLELKDLNKEDSENWPIMAQRILDNPLNRTLSSIGLIIENMSEEELI